MDTGADNRSTTAARAARRGPSLIGAVVLLGFAAVFWSEGHGLAAAVLLVIVLVGLALIVSRAVRARGAARPARD